MNATRIEWTERTWNPATGCSPVSEGCRNCYARRMAHRLRGRCGYPADEPFRVTLHPERLEEPLCLRKPSRIFVCSMGDLFHEDVPFEFIDEAFEIMALCQPHTFIVLTKRPARMNHWADTLGDRRPIPGEGVCTGGSPFCMGEYCKAHDSSVGYCGSPWPLPNIWLGVSAENQATADERIPILLDTPAAVRWVSVEPMLGPVDLTRWLECEFYAGPRNEPRKGMIGGAPWSAARLRPRPDWIVCGGETSPGARPMHPDWVRSLRDQCQAAGVPFYFKSWGEWWPSGPRIVENARMVMFGNEPMYRVGKKAAGRLLDGRTWDEYPKAGDTP